MENNPTQTMRAVAIDEFGGIEKMKPRKLPVPKVANDEILVRVDTAGVGVWDPFEREGGFAKEFGLKANFPLVLGSDGAGTVEGVGDDVRDLKRGDRVYGINLMSPKGGFYAEYTVIKAKNAAMIPRALSTRDAGVLAVDGVTALDGLDKTLRLEAGESILILGASGGIGHLAVQLAKRMKARVLAVASGKDGVEFVKRLGADKVIDGHGEDILKAAHEFAPKGLDAALLTAGGKPAEQAIAALREGGRAAYPNGVEDAPQASDGVKVMKYNGEPDPRTFAKLNELIGAGPFEVHIARTFKLEEAAEAQRALDSHYLGKLALVLS
ncbi:MAG: NADP-dependent oxidoreductase [Bryobacterales bacterium]|nr:NADP-dependent oxidoreductase [Bryobacterales bacterium]MBV9400443.1 NADP-dependent oxidoreductase [Bryobacterales bacterium]